VGTSTIIHAANGVDITLSAPAIIPAGNLGTGQLGTTTVSAHAVSVGTNGNIPSLAINQYCCSTSQTIFVKNTSSFSGGQDPKNYRFVQQSDITAVVDPLTQPLIQQAWSSVLKQVATGEQLMMGAQCTTSSNTDQSVGDKGINVTQATVTVAAKCTATAYNRQQMLDLVKNQLQKKADANLGTGYALVGNLQATAKPQPSQNGLISFIVNARGVWVYQFSDAQKLALAKEIAGKSLKDATTLLQGQKGVGKVQISGGSTLPTDPSQIAIQVQSITGLPASAAPPAVTPAVVNSGPGTNGATAIPGNG
jgi:hypothetical protein